MIDPSQKNLLHFISHEVKACLTKNQAVFAAIIEGDYGPVSDEIKNLAEHALDDTRKGVTSLTNILHASNLKNGVVKYRFEPFDLKGSITYLVEKHKKSLRSRKHNFKLDMEDGEYTVVGDEIRIRDHVIKNLFDNAIRYTKQGEIVVSLQMKLKKVMITVKDFGVGLSEEDKKNLFTEGGQGRNSPRINANSTGYGLFIAKQIVDAHDGKIWAESEGEGKGSEFFVELPNKL